MIDQDEIKSSWIESCAPAIKILLPNDLREEVRRFIEYNKLMDDHLLFQSIRTHKELSRQQAYRIIHHAGRRVRFVSWIDHFTKNILLIMLINRVFLLQSYKIFGSSDNSETVKFIGLSADDELHTIIALNL